MTEQEIFDKVVAHLRQQGQQSRSRDGKCVYRGENGLKCAVGCLISDEDYMEEFEGKDIRHQIFSKWGDKNRIAPTGLQLLLALQYIHDVYPVEYWEAEFLDAANSFELTYRYGQ